jgi:hypothetical protein
VKHVKLSPKWRERGERRGERAVKACDADAGPPARPGPGTAPAAAAVHQGAAAGGPSLSLPARRMGGRTRERRPVERMDSAPSAPADSSPDRPRSSSPPASSISRKGPNLRDPDRAAKICYMGSQEKA